MYPSEPGSAPRIHSSPHPWESRAGARLDQPGVRLLRRFLDCSRAARLPHASMADPRRTSPPDSPPVWVLTRTDIDGVVGRHVLGAQEGPSQPTVGGVRPSECRRDGWRSAEDHAFSGGSAHSHSYHPQRDGGLPIRLQLGKSEVGASRAPSHLCACQPSATAWRTARRWRATTIGVTRRHSANSGLDF